MPQPHPRGTLILVLGIVGLLLTLGCWIGVVLCIPAWVMGQQARKEIQQNPGAYSNAGQVTAGWVCGIIGTVLAILGVLLFILVAASG